MNEQKSVCYPSIKSQVKKIEEEKWIQMEAIPKQKQIETGFFSND